MEIDLIPYQRIDQKALSAWVKLHICNLFHLTLCQASLSALFSAQLNTTIFQKTEAHEIGKTIVSIHDAGLSRLFLSHCSGTLIIFKKISLFPHFPKETIQQHCLDLVYPRFWKRFKELQVRHLLRGPRRK
jgi:hypothetical protein